MSLVLNRVDDRLVHGQVTEVWIPYLSIDRIIVVDNRIAEDPKEQKILSLGVASTIQLDVWKVEKAASEYPRLIKLNSRILILFRELDSAYRTYLRGFRYAHLNLGNVHEENANRNLSPSVSVTPDSFSQLKTLVQAGITITIQAVPSDKEVSFQEFLK